MATSAVTRIVHTRAISCYFPFVLVDKSQKMKPRMIVLGNQ